MRLGRIVGLLVAFFLGAACATDEPLAHVSEGCLVNTDCNSPLVCAFRRCHTACTDSRDCELGQRCVESDRPFHVCQLAIETKCSYNSDCPSSQICGIDGECRDQCVTSSDCVSRQLCIGGTCAEDLELKDGGLVPSVVEGGDETNATGGQPCAYTSECPDPLVCNDGICAYECQAPIDCPSDRDCVAHRCVAGSGTLLDEAGGVVHAAAGAVALVVPPHALRGPVSILIRVLAAWPDGAVGPVIEMAPNGLTFDVPATLTFAYGGLDLGGTTPNQLRVAQALGPAWKPLVSTVDPTAQTVTAELAHLSAYGLVGPGVSMVGDAGPLEGGSPDTSRSDAAPSMP